MCEYGDYDPKVLALAQHLGADPDDISEHYDVFSVGSQEYQVLTDDEADQEWDDQLEQYLDDCVLPEVPETMQNYFDRDAWKRDAQMDGRGHAISGYDGCEYDEEVDGETFFIFRTN